MDDVLAWIGDQLLVAEQRPLRRRYARGRQARGRRLVLIAAAVSLLLAAAAVADASGLIDIPALWQGEPNVPSPEGVATQVPASLADEYAVLRRGRESRDSLSAGPGGGRASVTVPGGIAGHYGANPDLARYLGTIDGTAFWLVPGNLGSCVQTSDDGTVCTSNADMETSGALGLLLGTLNHPSTAFGVIPDGAAVTADTTDGSQATVQRAANAFMVSGTNLVSITIHQQDGHADITPISRQPTPSGPPPDGPAGPTGPSGTSGS